MILYENYAGGTDNNPDSNCNSEIDKLIDRQSAQSD